MVARFIFCSVEHSIWKQLSWLSVAVSCNCMKKMCLFYLCLCVRLVCIRHLAQSMERIDPLVSVSVSISQIEKRTIYATNHCMTAFTVTLLLFSKCFPSVFVFGSRKNSTLKALTVAFKPRRGFDCMNFDVIFHMKCCGLLPLPLLLLLGCYLIMCLWFFLSHIVFFIFSSVWHACTRLICVRKNFYFLMHFAYQIYLITS